MTLIESKSIDTIRERIYYRKFCSITGGRLDAHSNWKRLVFDNSNFRLVRMNEHVAINPRTTFSKMNTDSLVSFVPMEAVSEESATIIHHCTRPIKEAGAYTLFKEGDVIWAKITPCMENGKCAMAIGLVNGYGFGSTEFHVFRAKSNEISPEYIHLLLTLPILRNHAKLFFSGSSGHQRVDENFFHALKIPLPSPSIQMEMVSLMRKAYDSKKQKEEEAKYLLRNIDDMLLDELGIKFKPGLPKTIQSRTFKTIFSEATGHRWDPFRYHHTQKELRGLVYKYVKGHQKLRKCIIKYISGDWGEDDAEVFDENMFQRVLVIRNTEFDNNFNLKFESGREKYRLVRRDKLRALDIQALDILVEKSGGSIDQPVGRVAILTHELADIGTLGFSNFLLKIRPDTQIIEPRFLFFWLKTSHRIGISESMQAQTSGLRNLILEEFLDQDIPLPPRSMQTEIIKELQAIWNEAESLMNKAAVELEKAKREIESLILGK